MIKSKSNKLIIVLLAIDILVTGVFIFNYNRDKKLKNDIISSYKEMYMKNFYSDLSNVSIGELFDIRYINYNPEEMQWTAIDIIQKGNASIYDVDMTIILSSGERYEAYLNNEAAPEKYILGEIFGDTEIMHRQFNRIVLKTKIGSSLLFEFKDVDLQKFKIEIKYKDKKETHDLVYNEDKAKLNYEKFFNEYFEGEIEYSKYTQVWFMFYCSNYMGYLKRQENGQVQEFVDKFWTTYLNNKDYDNDMFYTALVRGYCHHKRGSEDDYFYDVNDLDKLIYKSREYFDLIDDETRNDRLRSILLVLEYSNFSTSKTYKDEISITIDEIYEKSKVTKEEFWEVIDKYLKKD